jgi:cation transport ATPase
MVGDGIHDPRPARESTGVILLGSDLSKSAGTLRVARRCRAIILPNFVGTLVVDRVGVGMAALGFLNPLPASSTHVTAELAFVLNSPRLLTRGAEFGR